MNNVADQLDKIEERVMEGLKDFQKATVERIDYLFRQGQRRVLVSDEVGLGKTLIASGTVAKTAKLRREKGDRLFKVVYICSNAAIADQNIRKLRITNEVRTESASSSRLSMQHLNFYSGDRRYPSARMNFSVSSGTPSGMYLFCLLYPSSFLTDCYDPIRCMNEGLSVREIQKQVRGRIAAKLEAYKSPARGAVDRR